MQTIVSECNTFALFRYNEAAKPADRRFEYGVWSSARTVRQRLLESTGLLFGKVQLVSAELFNFWSGTHSNENVCTVFSKTTSTRGSLLTLYSEYHSDNRHISGQYNVIADDLFRLEDITGSSQIDYDRFAADQVNDSVLQRLLRSPTGLEHKLRQTPLSSKPLYCVISNGKVIRTIIHGIAHPGIRSIRLRLVIFAFRLK